MSSNGWGKEDRGDLCLSDRCWINLLHFSKILKGLLAKALAGFEVDASPEIEGGLVGGFGLGELVEVAVGWAAPSPRSSKQNTTQISAYCSVVTRRSQNNPAQI